MSLFLNCKDCKAAIVLYHGKTVITKHNPDTQSLSLPVVPVLKKHLTAVIADELDEVATAVHETIVNIDLHPFLAAFGYAVIEHVSKLNYKIRSIKHIKDNEYDYLIKCDMCPSIKEIFAVEVVADEMSDETMVGIKIDKIFCRIGTASNSEMNVYYNGLKIDSLSAIVLIEYWNIKMAT